MDTDLPTCFCNGYRRTALRQRRHILDEHLPERQSRHAEYIQQTALTEVSVHISCILYKYIENVYTTSSSSPSPL